VIIGGWGVSITPREDLCRFVFGLVSIEIHSGWLDFRGDDVLSSVSTKGSCLAAIPPHPTGFDRHLRSGIGLFSPDLGSQEIVLDRRKLCGLRDEGPGLKPVLIEVVRGVKTPR
jgi:hypothetical protein